MELEFKITETIAIVFKPAERRKANRIKKQLGINGLEPSDTLITKENGERWEKFVKITSHKAVQF